MKQRNYYLDLHGYVTWGSTKLVHLSSEHDCQIPPWYDMPMTVPEIQYGDAKPPMKTKPDADRTSSARNVIVLLFIMIPVAAET